MVQQNGERWGKHKNHLPLPPIFCGEVNFAAPPQKSITCTQTKVTYFKSFARWWQLKHFICSPLPGEMIQFDEHIFQMGWNHQQVYLPTWKPYFYHSKTNHSCRVDIPFVPVSNLTHIFQMGWFNHQHPGDGYAEWYSREWEACGGDTCVHRDAPKGRIQRGLLTMKKIQTHMGVSYNRGTLKFMVYNGKPYFFMDDLGVPLFSETSTIGSL